MMDKNKAERLKTLMPLRELELEYKALYQKTGFETVKNAIDIEVFEEFLSTSAPGFLYLGSETLGPSSSVLSDTDATYFEETQDISAIQHLRYLPAIIHSHNFFEIAFVLNGSLTHFVGDNKTILESGDVLILAPNTEHSVCTYSDDAILVNILVRNSLFKQQFMNIIPDDHIVRSFFSNALYGNSSMPYLLFRTGDDPRLPEYIVNLLNEYHEGKPYKETVLTLMISLTFVFLLREHELDVVIPALADASITEKVMMILDYMKSNYASITLKQMSDFFNYSERQLSRIIKTATGNSFEEYIRNIRMGKARELLEYSDLTVAEISDMLGYYDTSNFRQAFKKYCGITPQEYRKQQQPT